MHQITSTATRDFGQTRGKAPVMLLCKSHAAGYCPASRAFFCNAYILPQSLFNQRLIGGIRRLPFLSIESVVYRAITCSDQILVPGKLCLEQSAGPARVPWTCLGALPQREDVAQTNILLRSQECVFVEKSFWQTLQLWIEWSSRQDILHENQRVPAMRTSPDQDGPETSSLL